MFLSKSSMCSLIKASSMIVSLFTFRNISLRYVNDIDFFGAVLTCVFVISHDHLAIYLQDLLKFIDVVVLGRNKLQKIKCV